MPHKFRMLNDNIGVFDGAMNDKWCTDVINQFDEKMEKAKSKINPERSLQTIDGVQFVNTESRVDVSIAMHDHESLIPYEFALKRKIEECYTEYWEQVNGQFTDVYNEWNKISKIDCKIQKSSAGGGFTKIHHEQGDSKQSIGRFAVWMVYLNDVHKGGTTDFPNQKISIAPKTGTMVLFPAAYTHPHRSSPDLQEDKFIATGWLVYKVKDDKNDQVSLENHRV